MRQSDVVVLDLKVGSHKQALAELMALLDEAVVLVRDLLTVDETPAGVELAARVEGCRLTGDAGAPQEDAAALSTIFVECRETAIRLQQQKADRARELTALIGALRDTIAAIGAEMDSLNSNLTGTGQRFESISQLSDPREMKARLWTEVRNLKQLAVHQREAWESTASSLKQQVTSLEHQLITTKVEALTDPLTGIANRRAFERTCRTWIEKDAAFAMALIDVDDFKEINDTHGHLKGDDVLRMMGEMMRGGVRQGDLVARLGGDEFGVLLSEVTLRQAETILTRLISASRTWASPGIDTPVLPNLSCGVAEWSAGDTVESLIARADDALYTAKRHGKNRVVSRTRPLIRDLMK